MEITKVSILASEIHHALMSGLTMREDVPKRRRAVNSSFGQ